MQSAHKSCNVKNLTLDRARRFDSYFLHNCIIRIFYLHILYFNIKFQK